MFIATMVGGPISGSLMLARDFKQIGDNRAARRSMLSGILSVLFLYAILLLFVGIRPFPNGVIRWKEVSIILVISTLLKLIYAGIVYFTTPPLLKGKINEINKINELAAKKENRASFGQISWLTFIGFFTFPVSVDILSNVTGTLLVLSFYFSFYLYARARKVYPGKFARCLFIFIFTIPFITYPLSLYEYSRPGLRVFLLVFTYSLVVMGYLFLFTVGLEAITAIIRFLKLIPGRWIKTKAAGMIGFYLVILGVSALIVHGHFNVVKPRIQTYNIQVPKRHTKLEKLKVVAAADFHLSNITGPHFLENVVEKINSLNPDLVLIAGDITIERSKVVEWKTYNADFRKIKSRYGVYTIIGNHELQYNPEKTLQFIERSNMRLLQDQVENIEDKIYILGRNDKSDKQRKSLEELMKSIKDDLPVIMMEHRISEMEKVEDKKIDLHISGHTHAGQLFPANLLMELIYKINWGYKKYTDTHFFVTSGVGTWGPPVRVGSFSEIMDINITFN
ncbi:MAG: uncharacterized protein QG657_563 [Acidobacteriota bacterium]|nr:uncharacterized protein [Acidobacteriota bacterium]